MRDKPNVKALSDDELPRRLSELLNDSRRAEADLIAHVSEVDARRLYAREAAPSMFAYCTEVLHLSEAEAWVRIRVARASRKHPMLLPMLRDGRLHLSAVVVLAPHLTADNRDALLRRAAHKTRRQIEELVAEVAPREDVQPAIRKLPTRLGRDVPTIAGLLAPNTVGEPHPRLTPEAVGVSDGQLTPETVGDRDGQLTPESVAESNAQLSPDAAGGCVSGLRLDAVTASVSSGAGPGPDSAASAQARSARIEPLAPARYKVQFTADAELREMLERLQALMRSSVPDGDLAALIKVAVAEKLERLEAKRFAKTKTPRKTLSEADTSPKSRHIPAAVRRAVHERDGGRCTYTDRRGRRCSKGHDLEFHHREPFGLGGAHGPKNVALVCRAHNVLLAEQDYGKELMAPFRRAASRVSEPGAVYGATPENGQQRHTCSSSPAEGPG